jgi:hypothetical protein
MFYQYLPALKRLSITAHFNVIFHFNERPLMENYTVDFSSNILNYLIYFLEIMLALLNNYHKIDFI